MSDPRPVAAIASELERVAGDIEYWCQDRPDLEVALHDALQAVHRTIVAVREAQAAADPIGFAEQWVG